ncbi:MAG: hypothetical protein ACI4IF_07550 [Acutalibacteraceae bacterium]
MYKKMYFRLFNIITDALEENNIEKMREILKKGKSKRKKCT